MPLVAILGLLLAGSIPPASGVETLVVEPLGLALSTHIVGDAALAVDPLVRSGAGTPSDPFVIRDWEILRTGAHGIRVTDTSAHLVIEDVLVRPPGTDHLPSCFAGNECERIQGFLLENASNVTIRRVTVERSSLVQAVGVQDLLIEDISGEPRTADVRPHNRMIITQAERVTIRRVVVEPEDPPGINSELDAIILDSVTHALVEDSVIGGDLSAHISVRNESSDIVIRGNVISLGNIEVGPGPIERLRVDGNAFGPLAGIRMSGLSAAEPVASVLVCGNRIASFGHTVFFAHAQDLHLVGNDLDAPGLMVYYYHVNGALHERNTLGEASQIIVEASPVRLLDNAISADSFGVALWATADASLNWWGATDGPSEDGPGSGAPAYAEPGATFTPWLAAPPDTSVDCSAMALPGV